MTALSVLEAAGRGAEKASEIAARLGTAQTNLGRTFQQLLDASVLTREIPFGESLRSTKRTRYRIQEPALRFWLQIYSPHRTRWQTYSRVEKEKLIHHHAATVFEGYCRSRHPAAARYWEANVEQTLPDGCGIQRAGQLKRRHPQLPVVIHTANGSPEKLFQALMIPAHGYVVKSSKTRCPPRIRG